MRITDSFFGRHLQHWASDITCYRRILMGLFVLALALRITVAFIHPYYLPDSADYSSLAKTIAAGHTYQVKDQFARRMPGYPVFVAIFYYLFGIHILPVLLVQACLGGITVILTAQLGRLLSPVTGLISGAMVAVDPLGIGFSAALLSETLFTCLLVLSVVMLVHLMDRPNRWLSWIDLGLIWAMMIYVRAEIALCLPPLLVLVIWMAKTRNRRRTNGLGGLLTLSVVFICLLPWWVRNYSNFHQAFFRFTTLEGISLYESVYSGATGGPRQSDLVIPPSFQQLNESQRDIAWTHRAFSDIFHHPWRMIRLAFIKIARTWSPWLHARGYSNFKMNILLTIWYTTLFIFAIAGMRHFSIKPSLFGVLLLIILYFTCMHAVFLGSVRYRVPVMPLVMVLAAVGIYPPGTVSETTRTMERGVCS